MMRSVLDTVQPAWKDVLPLRRTRCCSRADLFAALARAERRERPAGHRLLLLADVDDFRGYNARHGYASGDRVLARLDERLSSVAPAYRVGPDAFAALLHGSALDLARRLAQVLAALTIEEPEPLQCSLGAVLLPVEADGVAAFALAEERLEDQKRRGLLPADRIGEVLLAVMGAHDEALRVHAL